MARSLSSPILAQLRSAQSYSEQSAALQALKNEVVGHIQKKEAWVALGVLEPIAAALSSNLSPARTNGKDVRFHLANRPLSDEDNVKLQALQLVGSFANGGPPFLPPLHAAHILPAILNHISPYTNAPQIVVAALKALADIVDASSHAGPSTPLSLQAIADSLFASQHLGSLNAMLSFSSPKYLLQSQVNLAAGLICKLCRESRHQQTLASAGILDCLAARLASFAVAEGMVVPGADQLAQQDGLFEAFPDPATGSLKLGLILDAIASILGDSKYRAYRFIWSPAILAVFPSLPYTSTKGHVDDEHDMDSPGGVGGRLYDQTAMDFLLPTLVPSRGSSGSPTPVHSLEQRDVHLPNRQSPHRPGYFANWNAPRIHDGQSGDRDMPASESPLIPWLIHLVRTKFGYDRLMAAYLLTALFKAGAGKKTDREASIGLLVVPILVDMIAKNDKDNQDASDSESAAQRIILERAPAILAWLITDSESLQKAAFEADAVNAVSRLLKRAYDPVPLSTQARFWSPQPDTGMDVENSSPLAQLGESGENPLLIHKIKVREAALKAIGALASGKEDYRKYVALHDFVSYVVESVNEYPRKPKPPKERPKDQDGDSPRLGPTPGYGTNPVSVLIAGCYVVRMLSRSVSVLRTALVDYGVAMPIFHFLTHEDINVQIAATETMSNLVLEVSPVRELLTEKGVMRILCQHAHSENPALRLNAVWALKHWADAVSPDLKKSCLKQLEPEWLVRLICDDTQHMALFVENRNLTADDLDEDMEPETSDDPLKWIYGSDGSLQELDASQSSRLRRVEGKLVALRGAELHPDRRARNEDVAIQEQGLRLIQNWIGKPMPGPTAESPLEIADLIDHLFKEIGQDRFFDIIATKLRGKLFNPFSRRGVQATTVQQPHRKLVLAAIYVLVHLAASIPRHRQLIIAQAELLRLLAQQADSRDRDVRVALCHLVINLTWPDEDDREPQSWAQRAMELRKFGFHTKMENLKQQDRDLDVRERAKTAFWQMEKVAG